jgi:4-amino-4-deoxy-L-arabinose transferase-like glycosyltransferase
MRSSMQGSNSPQMRMNGAKEQNTDKSSTEGKDKDSYRCPWKIFWIALLVRLLYITFAHTYRFRTYPWPHHFAFGWEMGQIAAALATGKGYADPFSWGHTGPTAWTTPLFPLLLAGIFKLFGVFSLASGWVILAINSVFSALVVCTTWEIAARCFNLPVARWSSWIWALYPAAMQYAVRWVWEMSLTLLLFQWVLVLALRMRGVGNDPHRGTLRRWLLFGLSWGLIALSNPSLLLFLPISGLWILWQAHDWRQQLFRASLGALVCLSVIGPWTWRNWNAFHHFVPLRANFGVELYLGNGPDSNGLLAEYDHPNEALDQFRTYARMGELAYSNMRGNAAKALIRANPGHFAATTLKRIFYFWAGTPLPDANRAAEAIRNLSYSFGSIVGLLGLVLALQRGIPGAKLFAMAFLLLPLVYYAVTVHARFRHPLEPLIVILGVYLFQSAQRRSERNSRLLSDKNVDSRRIRLTRGLSASKLI